jgi:hypothetical protein
MKGGVMEKLLLSSALHGTYSVPIRLLFRSLLREAIHWIIVQQTNARPLTSTNCLDFACRTDMDGNTNRN